MAPALLDPRTLAAQIAQTLSAVGFYWLLGALLVFFFWRRGTRLLEPVLVLGMGWLLLFALGELLLSLTPCLAPNASLALGLVSLVALSFLLPLKSWQRAVLLALAGVAAAAQAIALGCAGPGGLWIGLGSAAAAFALVWLLGRWPLTRRLWQRIAINIDARSTFLARLPVGDDLRTALEAQLCRHLGLAVAHLQPLSADGAHTSTPIVVVGVTPEGEARRYFIKIITQSNWQAALLHGAVRWLQHRRRLKFGPLWLTLKALAEHEHYMSLLFQQIGAPIARPHGLYQLDKAVYALVSEFLEGARTLRSLGDVPESFVADGFAALRRLRDADYAHLDIKASNIMMVPGERFYFVDLAGAVNNAGPQRQSEDLSDLLVVMAMHHPPERVVAIARSTLGQAALREAIPYLATPTLNVETQKIVPLDLPQRLRDLIEQGGEPEHVAGAEGAQCPLPPMSR